MHEAEFRDAIAGHPVSLLHPRFGVFRNNVDGALCNALRVRFPAVEKLLGRREFARLAREYSSKELPQSPVLINYGHTFPEFIDTAGSGQYFLGDLARLENGWWKAYHAAESASLEPERFRQFTMNEFERLQFAFHPSVSLVKSHWAIGTIWEAVKQDRSMEGLKSREPEMVLVWRPEAEVHLHVVRGPAQSLLPCLIGGQCLAEAVETTLASHPNMDLQAELRMMISSRIVSGFKAEGVTCAQ